MKVLITGAHSTGKTSLINQFVENNKNYKFHLIKEVARDMIDSGITLGNYGNVNSYVYYINEQLKREIESESKEYDILIADRSIIDGITHPIVNNRLNYTSLPLEFIEMFENILFFQKSFYDIYVYIPISFEMVQDGNRPIDENFRKEIDKEIKYMLDKYVVNYYTLKSKSLESRYHELNQIINDKKLSIIKCHM